MGNASARPSVLLADDKGRRGSATVIVVSDVDTRPMSHVATDSLHVHANIVVQTLDNTR